MSNNYTPQYDLTTFASGALQHDFDRAIEAVFENMQDPNTPYKPKRSVTIKIELEQNEQRNDMDIKVVIDKKLVSRSSIKTKMAIEKDLKSGRIRAQEYGAQIRGQMSIDSFLPEEETEQEESGNITQMPERKVIGGE